MIENTFATAEEAAIETEDIVANSTTVEEAVEDETEVELTTLAEQNATLWNRSKNKGKGKKPNEKSTTTGE